MVRVTLMGAFLGVTLTACAQQPAMSHQATPPPPQIQGDDMRAMDAMRRECQETMASIDQLSIMIEAAKQSNDPAQMRAALDRAQKSLAGMKQRMERCMAMMRTMPGGMGWERQETPGRSSETP